MLEFFQQLLSSAGFEPHGHCYLWKPDILWLNVGSDALTALAYYSIPMALFYFARKRRDLAYRPMFVLFGAFIWLCGTTHAFEIWTVWHGTYRLEGVVKFVTGGVSVLTAALLWPIIPAALRLPSPTALERANWELRAQITARQQVEQQFRTVVESAPDALVLVNAQGVIELVNAQTEALFGYTRQELLGQPVEVLVPERFRRQHSSHRRDYAMDPMARPMGRGRDLYGLRKDGSEFPVEISLSPLVTAGETLILSTIRDITERVQAEIERQRLEEQLLQAQKLEALGTLAGGIAHDFNNLLAVIVGYTELALFDVPPENPAGEHLREVRAAGLRAKDLVQQILTFSRQHARELQPLDLRLVVTEALRLLRASLPATVEIQQHLATDTGAVMADVTQMHQVLMNLGANAEQVMRETGGVLEVRLEPVEVDAAMAVTYPDLRPGSYVRLTVRDTGPGIAPEIKARIFDPFFTTKAPGEGTGLGLAVVHGIIAAHGGVITVESTPGQGAAFIIHLPRLKVAAVADPASPETTLVTGSERILFVEDEEPLAHWGQNLLERLGYHVTVCTNGREALAAFRAAPHSFDLVVTDQTMPQMTGDALTRALRRIRPALPVILCTGYSHLITAEQAEAMGIDALCMKPLLARDLAETIRRVLTHHSGSPYDDRR
jgi:PAS domain S-box-containing protein